MDIKRGIREAAGFTPAEQQLGSVVLALGDRVQECSIKELSHMASVSIATVHRFCKKLGLDGFKQLKVELARASADAGRNASVDINFPFMAEERASTILPHMRALYEETLADTLEMLDPRALDRAAELLDRARSIDVYTQSHNLFPAEMFFERLISAGIEASCHERDERQLRRALASDERDVAVVISYSGLNPHLKRLIPLLVRQRVPVVFIGTPAAAKRNPGLTVYLSVSDREDLQERITQFASHIAVQFVLDALYSCLFARRYDACEQFLERTLPYSSLPGVERA